MGRKRTRHAKYGISVRYRILSAVILLQLPFCAVFFYNARITRDRVNAQLAQEQRATLTVFVDSLRIQMENTMEFQFLDCWNDESFCAAAQAETAAEALPLLANSLDKAENLLEANSLVTAVCIRNSAIGLQKLIFSEKNADKRYQDRMETLLPLIGANPDQSNTGWSVYRADGRSYLVRVVARESTHVIVVIDLGELTEHARLDYGMRASVVFRRNDELLTGAVWARDYTDAMIHGESKDGSYYFVTNRNHTYLVTEKRIAALRILCAGEYQYNWTWLYLSIGLLIAAVLLSNLVLLLYLRRTFFRPLDALVCVMREVQLGDSEKRAEHSGNREFNNISDSFNQMLDTLSTAKIEAYENQLKARRSQMDALRLQIRRHFFLNCLKNVYALACSGEIELVKQTSLLMSTNLRYTLNLDQDAVPMREELNACHDYIQLQGIGQEQKPQLITTIPEELEDFPVPPVGLLSMLENCCKYGMLQDRALIVSITAQRRYLDGDEYVHIAIQDNGRGFPLQTLTLLNNDLEKIREQGHVGFCNTQQRMKMLYGENCQMLFRNRNGARIEWIIAVAQIAKEGTQNA